MPIYNIYIYYRERENPVFSRVPKNFVQRKQLKNKEKLVGPIIHCSPVLTRVEIVSNGDEKEISKSKNVQIHVANCKKEEKFKKFCQENLLNNIALPEDEWFLSLVRK